MKVHFVIDEAATVKHLESIDDAINLGRGYGIRLILLFQSAGQIKSCFPEEGQDQTLLSNTSTIFFGINDQQTAELVSNRLGEKTIILDSGNKTHGSSRGATFGRERGSNQGTSASATQNWAQQARKLLKPEEVVALPPRIAITFTPGVPPICTTLIRYYEEKHLGRESFVRRSWAACSMLVKSAVLCALSVGMAMALANLVHAQSQVHQSNVFGER